jgi:geranylgeranyl pyrophosphate synthase
MPASGEALRSVVPATGSPCARPPTPPPRVRARSEALEGLLREELGRLPGLPEAALRMVLGGKRLRSALLFAAAPEQDSAGEAMLLRAAAAIEMVHAGSLLHDDIVDHARSRRGQPAVHLLHGERVAVESGTLVMSMAARLFCTLPRFARERVAGTARQAALGQLVEIARAGDFTLRAAERMEIMTNKTAVVFRLAGELGAALAGRPDASVLRLARAGNHFGLLFQIVDDLEDLCAPIAELGRMPGADIREGVVTLPCVFAAEVSTPAELAEAGILARRVRDAAGAAELVAFFRDRGALRRTGQVAGALRGEALRGLETMADDPGVVWIAALIDLLHRRMRDRLEAVDGC